MLTAAEREAIRHLATDIPALWAAATTTAADRKELVRQVVARVVVAAQGPASRWASSSTEWAADRRRDGWPARWRGWRT